MDITALDIKQQTFAKSIRGYDVAEVNAYLNLISTKWEHMVGKQKDMDRELTELREKIKHYSRVEEALHETLQTAKESAEQRLAAAKKEAQSRVEKAEIESDNILREARQARQHIKQSIMRLLERRDEIINGMGSFIETANRSLDTFKNDDAGVYNIPVENEDDFSPASATANKVAVNLPRKSKLGTGASASPTKTQAQSAPSTDLDDLIDELD